MTGSTGRNAQDASLALAMAALAFAVYVSTGKPLPDSGDSWPNAFLPVSLLRDGDLAFSPLEVPLFFVWNVKRSGTRVPAVVQSWHERVPGSEETFETYLSNGQLEFYGPRYFLVRTTRNRPLTGEPLFVGAFGPAPGLLGVPAAALLESSGSDLQEDPFATFKAARWTAAFLTAASVACVYLAASAFTTYGMALLLAALYAFGTCVWTISSQALWQQTPELFFLSLGVLCLVRGERAHIHMRGAAAGLAFAAAAACRPTAAIVASLAASYLYTVDRRALAVFLLASLPLAAGILTYNHYFFGSAFDFGQLAAGASVAEWKTGSPELWQTPVWRGAAGLLISPSRGLLIYSPFLAAAFIGAAIAWQRREYSVLRYLSIAVALFWLPAFAWFDWWGGWTYGYRPIVDSAPLLAVLCVPAIDQLSRSRAFRILFAMAAAWSVFVQILGVVAYRPQEWNARPIEGTSAVADIDHVPYRSRLWSFSDWQIGYLIARLSTGQR